MEIFLTSVCLITGILFGIYLKTKEKLETEKKSNDYFSHRNEVLLKNNNRLYKEIEDLKHDLNYSTTRRIEDQKELINVKNKLKSLEGENKELKQEIDRFASQKISQTKSQQKKKSAPENK